jgi:hypothetical protein
VTTYQWSAWKKTADENSGGPALPVGLGYQGEIIEAGAKATKSATSPTQLFWKVKVLVGPQAGKVERLTQTLTPGNERALAAFYGTLERLGIDMAAVPDGTPPESIAKLALGRRISFDLEHREHNNRKYADFKNVKLLDSVTVAPQAAAPPVSVPQVPVSVPVQPETPAAVAPVAVEAPAVAQPTPEQIAAFLAAQNAPAPEAAPAAAPAAPAAAGNLPF